MPMQEFKFHACNEMNPPPKDHITPPNHSPPLASNTKRPSHTEATTEEDKMADGERTLAVELVLGSSGRNDL
jgi:hypothetical protein